MKDEMILAIQNIGATIMILGFVLSILFVHYIESLYITGIVIMVVGMIDVLVVEKILDVRKENEYV